MLKFITANTCLFLLVASLGMSTVSSARADNSKIEISEADTPKPVASEPARADELTLDDEEESYIPDSPIESLSTDEE